MSKHNDNYWIAEHANGFGFQAGLNNTFHRGKDGKYRSTSVLELSQAEMGTPDERRYTYQQPVCVYKR